MEENREESQPNIGTREWLQLDIEERDKKENQGSLDYLEQQRASYQDVKATCDVAYLYRRNELDKLKNDLISDMLQSSYERTLAYCKTLIEFMAEYKGPPPLLKSHFADINLFNLPFKSILEEHLAGFFDKPKDFDTENQQVRMARETINTKDKILEQLFIFNPENQEYLGFREIQFNDVFEILYQKGEGELAQIINNIAQALAGQQHFKIPGDNVIDLREKLFDGRIYSPPLGNHNWSNNLSWLLAHIHKGNPITIYSDINPDLLTRTSLGYEKDLSGFAREIALLSKLEYRFQKISAHHYQCTPPSHSLQNLTYQSAVMPDNEVKHCYIGLTQRLHKKSETHQYSPATIRDKLSDKKKYAEKYSYKDNERTPIKKMKKRIPQISKKNLDELIDDNLELRKTRKKKSQS